MNIKLAGGVLFTAVVTALGIAGFGAIKEPVHLSRADNNPVFLQCDEYKTCENLNIDWTDISDWVAGDKAISNLASYSDIVTTVSAVNSARDTNSSSIKFGTGDKQGSLTLTCSVDIDAIGLYLRAWDGKDVGKTLKINDDVIDRGLSVNEERYFIPLTTATNVITITGNEGTPNRFFVHSIGFFSKTDFPPHSEPSEEGVANFTPSNFTGQGTSGTGSAISATVEGITFSCNKGYGTTQIRCYSGGKITINAGSKTITKIEFTFSGSYTGGLSTAYSDLNVSSWEQTLSSQARITALKVTFE